MTAEKLREQSVEELHLLLEESKRELFNMRVRSTTKELTDPNQIPMKKRDIARINTILTEKARQAG
ncbi:50S ribosomal protein L29 [bacterium]|nr:50S ribosomal protein L29 [bacterium]